MLKLLLEPLPSLLVPKLVAPNSEVTQQRLAHRESLDRLATAAERVKVFSLRVLEIIDCYTYSPTPPRGTRPSLSAKPMARLHD